MESRVLGELRSTQIALDMREWVTDRERIALRKTSRGVSLSVLSLICVIKAVSKIFGVFLTTLSSLDSNFCIPINLGVELT